MAHVLKAIYGIKQVSKAFGGVPRPPGEIWKRSGAAESPHSPGRFAERGPNACRCGLRRQWAGARRGSRRACSEATVHHKSPWRSRMRSGSARHIPETESAALQSRMCVELPSGLRPGKSMRSVRTPLRASLQVSCFCFWHQRAVFGQAGGGTLRRRLSARATGSPSCCCVGLEQRGTFELCCPMLQGAV